MLAFDLYVPRCWADSVSANTTTIADSLIAIIWHIGRSRIPAFGFGDPYGHRGLPACQSFFYTP